MVAIPGARPVTVPRAPPPPLLTPATAASDDDQVAIPVTLRVLPSLKMAVAAKGCVWATRSDAVTGATLIAVKVAAVTVTCEDAESPMKVAVMVAVPGARPVTVPRPLWFETPA